MCGYEEDQPYYHLAEYKVKIAAKLAAKGPEKYNQKILTDFFGNAKDRIMHFLNIRNIAFFCSWNSRKLCFLVFFVHDKF